MSTLRSMPFGFALLPAVLTLAMLGVIAVLLFERGGMAGSVTVSEQRGDALAYAAEAGYAHAKALLGTAGGCAALPTLSDASFGSHTYSAALTPGATVPGSTLLFQSVADSWLKSADDDANFGSDKDLKNKRKSGDHEETVIRFDLASLPADLDIATATLYVTVKARDTSGSPIEIFRIDSAWTENTVSWDNEGTDYDPALVHGSFVTASTGLLGTDVTRLVRQWVSGAVPNYGLRFVSTSNDRESVYGSREEDNAANRPWLHIVTRASTRVETEAIASDAGGASRTVKRTLDGPADGAVVLDRFNSGFDGSDGTRGWSGSWQEMGESNGAAAGAVQVATNSKCAHGSCLRLDAGLLSTAGASRALSFAGADSAFLRVHTRRDGGNWTLQVSGNGGGSWQTLKTAASGNDSKQVKDTFNVTAYATADMRIRFTSSQLLGLGTKEVYIDDVEVEAACVP